MFDIFAQKMSETKLIYCENRSSFNRLIFAALVSRLLRLASPFFSSEESKKKNHLILPFIKHLSVTWDTWGWGGATALVKWPTHTFTAQEVTVWNLYGCVEPWKWNTACCCTICFTALYTKKKRKPPAGPLLITLYTLLTVHPEHTEPRRLWLQFHNANMLFALHVWWWLGCCFLCSILSTHT